MGRPMKVTPLDVLEKIKENERTTKEEIADEFNVCPQTVGNRLKDLRDNGCLVHYGTIEITQE